KAATVFASSSDEALRSFAVPNANAIIIKISFRFPASSWMKSRVWGMNEIIILFQVVRSCYQVQVTFFRNNFRSGNGCLFSQFHKPERAVMPRARNAKPRAATGNVAVECVDLRPPAAIQILRG